MAIPLSVWLRCLFLVMPCAMAVTLIYTFAIAGSPFTSELLSPWMATTILDFYINVVPLATWICYKEAKPINSTIWVILVVIFGSTAMGFYIFIQLLNLSSEEALQDPVYHVLLRHQKKDDVDAKKKLSPVITARIAFSALGCLMLGTLMYTLVTDGSPFRKELLTPWMTALLVDFYCHVVILSIWVAYKESSWITAFVWIVLLICFGSITTCAYIAKHVFQLSSEDPLFVVLLNNSNRFEPWVRPIIATVFDPFRADVVIFVGEKKPALEGVLMKQAQEGREILLERPRARSTQVNLRNTWGLPHNSFGAAYARFAQRKNFSPDDRAPAVRAMEMEELEYVEMRVGEVRDFWHVLFGIPTDVLGKSTLKVIECKQLGIV